MDNDSLYQDFLVEAAELVDAAEDALLSKSKDDFFEVAYNEIYRSFHSLKGAAGMFGIDDLNQHMHQLEDVLTQCKKNSHITENLIDYFLSGLDSVRSFLTGEELEFSHQTYDGLTGGGDPTESHPEAKSETKEKDEGKTVEVKAEKSEQKDSQNQYAEVAKERKQKSTKKYNGRVIAIDDEEELLAYLCEFLEENNYEVIRFNDPTEFKKQMKEHDFDLVITDLKMPKMTGVEIVECVHSFKPMLPIILLSAFLTSQSCIDAIYNGATALIQKPFNPDDFKKLVDSCVRKYKLIKLVDQSIHCLLYQFNDLDEYLKSAGKEDIRQNIKNEILQIVEMTTQLRKGN